MRLAALVAAAIALAAFGDVLAAPVAVPRKVGSRRRCRSVSCVNLRPT